ncbi:MAG: hypothetical protein ACJ8CB_03285, partial [Ktedonobacteraceae bacterium]
PDVPERVAQDREVQEHVLKTQGRETSNGTARKEHPKTSSSMHQVEQSHTVEVTKSASQTSSQRGALVGAIRGESLQQAGLFPSMLSKTINKGIS